MIESVHEDLDALHRTRRHDSKAPPTVRGFLLRQGEFGHEHSHYCRLFVRVTRWQSHRCG